MRVLPTEIAEKIARLEGDISKATTLQLMVLQPKFHSFLRDLTRQGYEIPARLRNLDHDLEEDVVEAQFDNLPL